MTPYGVGDTVQVLNAFRLPAIEEVRHVGTVERITDGAQTLYWVSGLSAARAADVLRLVRRAR